MDMYQDSQHKHRPTEPRIFTIALVVVLCIASFMAGIFVMWAKENTATLPTTALDSSATVAPEATPQLTREQGIKLLVDIMQILDKEYIDSNALDDTKMLYSAAAGLVAGVGDEHTMFQEPVAAGLEAERMEGSFEGIGASVTMSGSLVTIAQPMPGSPALKAGIQAGDVILEVDGVSVDGLSLTEVVSKIRGPRGSQVRLLLQRASVDEPLEILVTRDRIEIETVSSRMLDGDIGYVQLSVFNAVATDQLTSALRELLAKDPVGLILDLRGNPGGYLVTAVEVASQFLPKNTLILSEEKRDEPLEEFRVEKAGLATSIPLVVLVDGDSASASEIVAGAVQDNNRGKVIGTKTYGKGSVQASHEMVNGSSLRVTIAKWNRPNGSNIDGNGIMPDIVVEYTQEDRDAGRDPQLDRAVQELSQ
ncbi:MAG: S41 family peptidase [Chloroflexi bacterium]|nr:S41 family peptidase [Chloroflexota bacterium]